MFPVLEKEFSVASLRPSTRANSPNKFLDDISTRRKLTLRKGSSSRRIQPPNNRNWPADRAFLKKIGNGARTKPKRYVSTKHKNKFKESMLRDFFGKM